MYFRIQEILLCGVGFKNDIADRRVLLYLNVCDCGRKHCQESAALVVKNHLKRVSLKEAAIEFLIEYLSLSHAFSFFLIRPIVIDQLVFDQ